MIDVINLEKHFGDNEVLRGIDVTINKGDIVVVIGPSGSGKSTFLRCLNRLEDIDSGTIKLRGRSYEKEKKKISTVREQIGNFQRRGYCRYEG